jgi:photosystem II stability/assembly factor-like uncharacterized protein
MSTLSCGAAAAYRRGVRTATALATVGLLIAACAPETVTPSASPVRPTPTSAQPTAATAPPPTPSPSSTPTGAAPTAVRFVDSLHGWLGTQDAIFATKDGGATWDRQLTGGSITKIWSYDATHAWALAADNALYRTQDGVHWLPIEPRPNPPITQIDAFTPDLVWAIGVTPTTAPQPAQAFGNVMRSTDGGATWQVVGTHTMWSVCFETTTEGAGAEGKQLFRTADAGRTWTPTVQLPINDDGPYWYPTLTCPNGTNFRVQVTEPNAAAGHAPYLVFRTNTGGSSWQLEFREGYTLGTTTPPNTPQLGTFPSMMQSTLAGGRTWFITCSPGATSLEFLFLGPTGETLARGPVPIPDCAVDGQVIDGTHVVVVAGSTSSVIATDDGGVTWRTIYKGRPRV